MHWYKIVDELPRQTGVNTVKHRHTQMGQIKFRKLKESIQYTDDSIIVVDKPSGIPSIPDRWQNPVNLLNFLTRMFGKVYPVHRLDKDTSGIMVYARTAEAHRQLSLDFQHRRVSKTYLAFVEGVPMPLRDIIDIPLRKAKDDSPLMIPTRKGKPAKTRYRVLESYRQAALIEAEILTGRTHQIRAHLKAIGHPLLIDPLYGFNEAVYVSQWKGKKYKLPRGEEEKPLLSRLTLHSHRLCFTHPANKEHMEFTSPLPADLKALQYQLRKWLGTDDALSEDHTNVKYKTEDGLSTTP